MINPPVLVQLEDGVAPPAYLRPWHPEPFGNPALAAELGLDRWYLSPGGRVPPGAVRAEADSTGTVARFPPDPLFNDQWSLYKPPPEAPGIASAADMDIDALAAFALLEELRAIGVEPARGTLAILDTEMLLPQAWSGEIPIVGYWNTSYGVPYHVGAPSCPHATHVASIAASRANNRGIAGVAWSCDVLAVQVLTGCYGYQQQCASGVVYATDHGADVINMSLQYGAVGITLFSAACEYARESGVVVVAASGNYSWTTQTAVPSCFESVISVGAIDREGRRPSWSNGGPNLDLCAPGDLVPGLVPAGFQAWSGTSMAAPHVSGAASVLRSLYPALDAKRIREVLVTTADDMGDPGHDELFGFGRLNLYRAIIDADPCYGDFNRDGALDAADLTAFQLSFALGQHRANCTGDLDPRDAPILTADDWVCFVARHGEGCP